MSGGAIRVLLVDDHAVVRSGLRALLDAESDIEIAGEAGSGEEALRAVEVLHPDIVVMDLGMPGMNVFDAIRRLGAADPPVRVIVLSMHKGQEFVRKALEAGAEGYVPKSSAHADLLRAIRLVHDGKRYLDPAATSAIVELVRGGHDAGVALESLSTREIEVLRLIAMGHTSREVAETLNLSPKTVDSYRQRIMEKLQVTRRSGLVKFAMLAGLLDDDATEA